MAEAKRSGRRDAPRAARRVGRGTAVLCSERSRNAVGLGDGVRVRESPQFGDPRLVSGRAKCADMLLLTRARARRRHAAWALTKRPAGDARSRSPSLLTDAFREVANRGACTSASASVGARLQLYYNAASHPRRSRLRDLPPRGIARLSWTRRAEVSDDRKHQGTVRLTGRVAIVRAARRLGTDMAAGWRAGARDAVRAARRVADSDARGVPRRGSSEGFSRCVQPGHLQAVVDKTIGRSERLTSVNNRASRGSRAPS